VHAALQPLHDEAVAAKAVGLELIRAYLLATRKNFIYGCARPRTTRCAAARHD